MKSKTLRTTIFIVHRSVGFVAGLILTIVGVTGSFLVFQKEWDSALVRWRFGAVTGNTNPLEIERLVEAVQSAYSHLKGAMPNYVSIPPNPSTPYTIGLQAGEQYWDVFINPLTGQVLGDRQWETSLVGRLFELHIRLLSGDRGTVVVGIAAFLLLILSITGLLLWPGWNNLINGFKIKFKAHPKRRNFDIHKVTGIVTIVFLSLIAFTGFCWNFQAQTEPIIYALTQSSPPPKSSSKPATGKSPLSLTALLQIANNTLPGSHTTFISIPTKPTAVFFSSQDFPKQSIEAKGQTRVYIDQYTGSVLYLKNALKPSLGDRILNSFAPLHYGTFGGLPTRILYVFVGLAPLILFVTGFIMWWHRRKPKMKIADRL